MKSLRNAALLASLLPEEPSPLLLPQPAAWHLWEPVVDGCVSSAVGVWIWRGRQSFFKILGCKSFKRKKKCCMGRVLEKKKKENTGTTQ